MRVPTAEVSYLSADQIAYALDVKVAEIGLRKRMEQSARQDASAQRREPGERRHAFFSNDELDERYSDLFQMAELFVETHAEQSRLEFEISPIFLYEATIWSYDEISRLKTYHLSDPVGMEANAYRNAAIFCCALAKFRPIWVRSDINIKDERFQDLMNEAPIINELFAIYVATVRIAAAEGKDFDISNEEHYKLVHYLREVAEAKGLEIVLKSIVEKYLS